MGHATWGKRQFAWVCILLILLVVTLLLNILHLSSTAGPTQSAAVFTLGRGSKWWQQFTDISNKGSPGMLAGASSNSTASIRADPMAHTKAVKLFVGVLSSSQNRQARDAIRAARVADERIATMMFFMQRPKSDSVFKQLRDEAVSKGDIVITTEVFEDYYNITYSVLELFKTAARWGDGITHVLKTDDDVYIRFDALLSALEAMPQEWLYAGTVDHGSVIRTPGWHYVPYDNWASDMPVRYAFGWGYVTSVDIAIEVALGAAHVLMPPTNLLIIEDVAVGYWVEHIARERNVTIHHEGLSVGETCTPDTVIFHVKSRPQWPVLKCMHERNGSCC